MYECVKTQNEELRKHHDKQFSPFVELEVSKNKSVFIRKAIVVWLLQEGEHVSIDRLFRVWHKQSFSTTDNIITKAMHCLVSKLLSMTFLVHLDLLLLAMMRDLLLLAMMMDLLLLAMLLQALVHQGLAMMLNLLLLALTLQAVTVKNGFFHEHPSGCYKCCYNQDPQWVFHLHPLMV